MKQFVIVVLLLTSAALIAEEKTAPKPAQMGDKEYMDYLLRFDPDQHRFPQQHRLADNVSKLAGSTANVLIDPQIVHHVDANIDPKMIHTEQYTVASGKSGASYAEPMYQMYNSPYDIHPDFNLSLPADSSYRLLMPNDTFNLKIPDGLLQNIPEIIVPKLNITPHAPK